MNKQRLLARSRKRRSPGGVIGQVGPATKTSRDAGDGEASDVDPEIYDDFDFYTSQLEKVGVHLSQGPGRLLDERGSPLSMQRSLSRKNVCCGCVSNR